MQFEMNNRVNAAFSENVHRYGHLGMTSTFRDPQCEHFHRRHLTIDGKGVSSDRPSVSSIKSAPWPQFTSLHDLRNRVTP